MQSRLESKLEINDLHEIPVQILSEGARTTTGSVATNIGFRTGGKFQEIWPCFAHRFGERGKKRESKLYRVRML